MMQLLRLPNISGNGADGLLTVECPIGYKYRNLQLVLASGTCTAAMVTQAQVLLNGQAAWDITGPLLDAINQVDGLPTFAASGVLNFPFTFPGITDDVLADLTAINTGITSPATGKVIHTMQIRLTLSGTTSPNFEAYATVENSTSEGPGVIRRLHRYSFSSAVGESGYNTLDYGTVKDAFIRRLMVVPSSGTLSRLRVVADTREVLNAPTAVLSNALSQGGFTPGSYFGAIADFAANGRGFLPTQMPYLDTTQLSGRSLTFYVTNSAAGSNVIIADNIGEV
jgi:hypothetical protein